MWIARTEKYTYTLAPNGGFTRANSNGTQLILHNANTAPRDQFVALIPGLDDKGDEVICLVRLPNQHSGPMDGRYEMYLVDKGVWISTDSDKFYKFTHLDHIRNMQKQQAEDILLGQV